MPKLTIELTDEQMAWLKNESVFRDTAYGEYYWPESVILEIINEQMEELGNRSLDDLSSDSIGITPLP